jgi:hypothetical protein
MALIRPLRSLRLLILMTAAPAGRPALHRHGDDLGVGLGAVRADRVGVALHELAEPAGTGLLVAPDRTVGIAAERLRQAVPVLGGEAGQRRGQVVAQRHPLVVVVGQREDAFVGAVGVRQELAERIGVFERPGLQRLEAPTLIDAADGRQDGAFGGHVAGAAIDETAGRAGHGSFGWSLGHGRAPIGLARRDQGRFVCHGFVSRKSGRGTRSVSAAPSRFGRSLKGAASARAHPFRTRRGRMVGMAMVARDAGHGGGL